MKKIIQYIIKNTTHTKWHAKMNIIYPHINDIVAVTSFLPTTSKISERFYCILNDVVKIPICRKCNIKRVKYKTGLRGYQDYCGLSCMSKGTVNQKKNTNLKRYGVEHALQSPIIQQKSKEILIKNQGGIGWASSKIKTKCDATMIKRYGVTNIFENNEYIQSCFYKKYGVTNPMYVKEIRNTLKETIHKKYGCDNVMQNAKIAEKQMLSSLNFKEYKLPSGKIIKVQGNEPQALDILLKIYDENDIITQRSKMPEIWYNDIKETKRKYYPDFYIPKDNLLIDVKSEYTMNISHKINIIKKEACENTGYKFKFMIL